MNAVTDGFGNSWPRCELNDCGLHVVRPGKVQCWCDDAKGEVLALRRHNADQGLTLATLCDLILGEDADDRSDTALIRGASLLVRGRDEQLHKMQRLRNEVARLNGQTMWVCSCGGTDCAGRKDNAALKIEVNRLRRALLDCSDAAIGGSTLAEWIRGKVATTLGKEAQS